MTGSPLQTLALAASAGLAACAPLVAAGAEPASLTALAARSPAPPWPAGDERGMANTLGEATTLRCGWHLSQRGARTYEASFERSNAMPKSPFANPSPSKPKPTAGVPFSAHAFNSEAFDAGAEPQQQGTQIDALGHFGSLAAPWDPKATFSADGASYYGGFKQQDVKPSPDSPLLKLGIEKMPPLVTTAVLLDARAHVGKGTPMADGQLVTAADIQAMLKAQGLSKRGILPGDMVWIYTGWSEHWKEGDAGARYYTSAPGLAVDAAKLLSSRRIVAVGLDTPFVDAVPEGMLQGKAPPAKGTEPGLPFSIHHYMLSVFGIHHLENLNLAAMARDRVWTSCAMVLPSRDKGAAGAVVRPVAIGIPGRR
ncbi:MAG TPA: cyclase family protein [Caldimonas sp.]|jgi:kynurenine formamidase|nr:cyclase family protein [Caldimonas sp.]HEX2542636.1 cyclase family protein [Caldimonas sp.]